MLEFIVAAFNAVVTFLGSLLPTSPFANIQLAGDMGLALGWLNWVVPIQACGVLFAAWLAAFAVYIVVKFVKKHTLDIVGNVAVSE